MSATYSLYMNLLTPGNDECIGSNKQDNGLCAKLTITWFYKTHPNCITPRKTLGENPDLLAIFQQSDYYETKDCRKKGSTEDVRSYAARIETCVWNFVNTYKVGGTYCIFLASD